MSCFRVMALVCLWMGTQYSIAQSLPQSTLWRRGQIINPGQSQFSFTSTYFKVSHRLSNDGEQVPLGQAYSQVVTWGDILGGDGAQSQETGQLRAYMESQGWSDEDVAAISEFDVNEEKLALRPQWSYGLTPAWMVGIIIPLYYQRTEIQSRTRLNSTYTSRLRDLAEEDPELARILKSRAEGAVSARLEASNYESLEESRSDFFLGDVELLSKTKLFQSASTSVSLKQRVVLPTGEPSSPYQYIHSLSDDGQLDLGLDAMMDYWFAKRWMLNSSLGYTWQSPDEVQMRLPQVGSRLSQDIDHEVSRDLGDYWSWRAFLEYIPATTWSCLLGYEYRLKTEDSYRGSSYEPDRYRLLEEDSKQVAHLGYAGVSYRLAPFFERGGVKEQMATNLFVSQVLGGQNIPETPTASLELLFFF